MTSLPKVQKQHICRLLENSFPILRSNLMIELLCRRQNRQQPLLIAQQVRYVLSIIPPTSSQYWRWWRWWWGCEMWRRKQHPNRIWLTAGLAGFEFCNNFNQKYFDVRTFHPKLRAPFHKRSQYIITIIFFQLGGRSSRGLPVCNITPHMGKPQKPAKWEPPPWERERESKGASLLCVTLSFDNWDERKRAIGISLSGATLSSVHGWNISNKIVFDAQTLENQSWRNVLFSI